MVTAYEEVAEQEKKSGSSKKGKKKDKGKKKTKGDRRRSDLKNETLSPFSNEISDKKLTKRKVRKNPNVETKDNAGDFQALL